MKLKYKTSLILVILCGFFATSLYLSVRYVFEDLTHKLVWKYAHVATHYDIETTLKPILHEIEEISDIASHPDVVSWAKNPEDERLRTKAEYTLERFRWRFTDKNFFIALDKNLSYYFNSAEQFKSENFYRYTLTPASHLDLWYFKHKAEHRKVEINVDRDRKLGIEKLWINHIIEKDGEFLGLMGTGMEVKPFVNSLIAHHGSGVDTLFVDHDMRVQLQRDSGVFQYRPMGVTNKPVELKDILVSNNDYQAIISLMERQKRGEEAHTLTLDKGEKNQVVTIHYVEALDWYELTFVNIDTIVDPQLYSALLYLVCGLITVLGALIYLLIAKGLTRQIERIATRLRLISRSESSAKNEFSSIEQELTNIHEELSSSRSSLKRINQSKPSELYQLAMLDPITGLLNQMGMERELSEELAKAKRENIPFGLVWMEVEQKSHRYTRVSTEGLKMATKAITHSIREFDSASHWEGDEFLVLVRSSKRRSIFELTTRVNTHLEQLCQQQPECENLTIHIGGVMISPNCGLQDALTQADSALYLAKTDQNRVPAQQTVHT
ncbi:GGDEF domain-containing protein [Vibrio sonorensis]|uniref:GGDEF domain-containing protein n=1 Tax=Vibrio sonorensis TaxID=1004316 RepID=UPI0008D9088F|nr:GGDEF domain-containing protein [Vibrio sonorensis]